MSLDVAELFENILNGMQTVLDDRWPDIEGFAMGEAKKLAETMVQIERLKLLGQVTEGEASILLEMQKNTSRAVLLTLEGMGLLLVEEAINAALKAIRDTVNGALDFALL